MFVGETKLRWGDNLPGSAGGRRQVQRASANDGSECSHAVVALRIPAAQYFSSIDRSGTPRRTPWAQSHSRRKVGSAVGQQGGGSLPTPDLLCYFLVFPKTVSLQTAFYRSSARPLGQTDRTFDYPSARPSGKFLAASSSTLRRSHGLVHRGGRAGVKTNESVSAGEGRAGIAPR